MFSGARSNRNRLPIFPLQNTNIGRTPKNVNSQIKDETALRKLMHDFFCTNSKDMNYSILAQRVRYFKEDTKGVAAMCRAMEKMRDETEHETSVKHALAMLADGVPCEKVAKYTDLSIEEVRALAEKKSA